MAKATKPKAKAKAKPATKVKTKGKPAKAKAKAAKKPTKKSAKKPAKKPAKQPKPVVDNAAVEQQVAEMLADYDNGVIDNAFDVIGDAYELDKQLPKTSKLRSAFDKMYRELGEICQSVGG